MSASSGTALGLGLGFGLDLLLGDPQRVHPVAAFGTTALGLERRLYAPNRRAGAVHLTASLTVVALVAASGRRLGRGTGRGPGTWPAGEVAVLAAGTWTVLGGRSLVAAAEDVGNAVVMGDLDAARRALPSLCGRDPHVLDAAGLVRATVESVAENTSDAVVAPLFWGAVAGLPGLLLYRAVNTLDAMVGHRSERYADFGTPAARLDDIANWLPARMSAALAVGLAPLVGGSPRRAIRAWRRDAAAHPSPNAGRVEAAFAGALGVRLGGPLVYPYGEEVRPVLGDGRPAEAHDVARAVRLSRLVGVAALVACAALASVLRGRR